MKKKVFIFVFSRRKANLILKIYSREFFSQASVVDAEKLVSRWRFSSKKYIDLFFRVSLHHFVLVSAHFSVRPSYLSVCLSVVLICPSVHWPLFPFFRLFFCRLFVCPSIRLSVNLPVYSFVCPSVDCHSVRSSVLPSVCLPIYQSVNLYIKIFNLAVKYCENYLKQFLRLKVFFHISENN